MIDRAKLLENLAAIKQFTSSLTVIIGSCGTLAAAVALVVQDPCWILYSLAVAGLFFALGIVASFLLTEKVPLGPIAFESTPMEERRRTVPGWGRDLFIVATIAVAFGILTVCRFCDFSDVYVGKLSVWEPQYKIVDGKAYRSGAIGAHDGTSTSFFFPGPYYLKFAVQKAKRHKRVNFDGIVVTVLEYTPPKPKGEIRVWTSFPMDQETLLLVEIDDPNQGKKIFNCDRTFRRANGEYISNPFISSYIDHDNPETIVVKIDAKSPGIYKFKVELQVSVGMSTSTIPVQTETIYYPPDPPEEKPAKEE